MTITTNVRIAQREKWTSIQLEASQAINYKLRKKWRF